jgi:hypothetical protein
MRAAPRLRDSGRRGAPRQDLSSLDRVYRIVSFIVLGAILLAVSYLDQKSQQRAAAAEADATPFDADARGGRMSRIQGCKFKVQS